MLWRRLGGLAAMLCVCALFDGFGVGLAADSTSEARPYAPASKPRAAVTRQKDGTVLIAGRSLRCGRNRHVLDRGLPNLGLAAPGVLVLNPRELGRLSDTVRLFVYHHECGHHKVGGSELGADCWAVNEGVRNGWLSREALAQVCDSFGNGPATSTHPSGASRCAALNRCFTGAVAALAKEKAKEKAIAEAKAAPTVPRPSDAGPKLLKEPTLQRSGMRPSKDLK